MRKKTFLLGTAVALALGILLGADGGSDSKPQYGKDGHLLRPENFREWIFLSSGLGMNYNPQAGGHEMFTNVFVPQWAYREFVNTGKWPDKTTFVVEERGADSKASINKAGHYQTDMMGYAVEVKDSSRPELWSYYGFTADSQDSAAAPKQACWQCHEDHAAVEHSFVQFYPTLKPIAKKYGTYKEAAERVTP